MSLCGPLVAELPGVSAHNSIKDILVQIVLVGPLLFRTFHSKSMILFDCALAFAYAAQG